MIDNGGQSSDMSYTYIDSDIIIICFLQGKVKFNSRGDRENLTVLLQQFRVDSSELCWPYDLVLFDGIDDYMNT